ncbi:cytochrome C assembly family protein [Azospira restricta]|uniref:Cytochrome c biogenesis protein CcsA n=1 Tax=Azospira restricta TaxID=404405 RepID=A0A974Y577_9RHOO|nr:cytochrome c biogenesis protein CcsA [Azospira restricta]QRJ65134.1 cytochrome c biogenesis protein CcsA [Azospira restricta]
MPGILLHLLPNILAAVLYALLGLHFWRTRWKESDKPLAAQPMQDWERAAIGGTLLIHGFGLYAGLFGTGTMQFSFSLALSLMLWLAVFIYWLESFRSRMDGLQPMVLPLAAACAALPAVFPNAHALTHAGTWGFRLHFIAAMLAYSLFTLSALHAVFMGYTERKLHQRALTKSLASLPPLLTMEALLFRMIGVGFLLLTAALVSGSFFSEELFGKALTFDHKTLFAFISWGIFAALLTGRHVRGWRGRTALRWTMAGFTVLLLAYIGSRFVLEVLLGRA